MHGPVVFYSEEEGRESINVTDICNTLFLKHTWSDVGVTWWRTLVFDSGVQIDELESEVLALTSSSNDLCLPSKVSIRSWIHFMELQISISLCSILDWKD